MILHTIMYATLEVIGNSKRLVNDKLNVPSPLYSCKPGGELILVITGELYL